MRKKIVNINIIIIILFKFVMTTAAHAAGIVITEIHRDPAAGNKSAVPGGVSHSFVELTNLGRENFHFENIFMTNGKTVDTIMPINTVIAGHEECVYGQNFIAPGETAVILSQSYVEGITIDPASIHPFAAGTVLFAVNRRNIGGGLANDDGVAIYRGTRQRIDELIDIAADADVFLSAPLQGKIVLSARQVKGVSIVPASIMLGGGGGGVTEANRPYVLSPLINLSPGEFPPLVDGVYVEHYATMLSENVVTCSIAGIFVTADIIGASWRFFSQMSPRSSSRQSPEISQRSSSRTSRESSVARSSQRSSSTTSSDEEIASGNFANANVNVNTHNFIIAIDIMPEERSYFFEITTRDNDHILFPIDLSSFWAAAGTLVISEIFPKGGTAAAAGEPEWFELHNISAADVNLSGWSFANSKDTATIIASDFFIPQGGYVVITRDDAAMRSRYRTIERMIRPTRWLTLNSFNDTLTIRSPHGIVVDRAAYRSAWFTRWTRQSLERVMNGASGLDSSAWVLCDRPTPGHPGSADLWRSAREPSIEIGPTPFSPNGDGVDDALSIRLTLPANYRARIRIFSFNGQLLRTFETEREIILWDGMTDGNRPASVGPIYVVAEFTSGGERRLIRKNGVLWR